jgi:acetate kinase
VSAARAQVAVLVVAAAEEIVIARETARVLSRG